MADGIAHKLTERVCELLSAPSAQDGSRTPDAVAEAIARGGPPPTCATVPAPNGHGSLFLQERQWLGAEFLRATAPVHAAAALMAQLKGAPGSDGIVMPDKITTGSFRHACRAWFEGHAAEFSSFHPDPCLANDVELSLVMLEACAAISPEEWKVDRDDELDSRVEYLRAIKSRLREGTAHDDADLTERLDRIADADGADSVRGRLLLKRARVRLKGHALREGLDDFRVATECLARLDEPIHLLRAQALQEMGDLRLLLGDAADQAAAAYGCARREVDAFATLLDTLRGDEPADDPAPRLGRLLRLLDLHLGDAAPLTTTVCRGKVAEARQRIGGNAGDPVKRRALGAHLARWALHEGAPVAEARAAASEAMTWLRDSMYDLTPRQAQTVVRLVVAGPCSVPADPPTLEAVYRSAVVALRNEADDVAAACNVQVRMQVLRAAALGALRGADTQAEPSPSDPPVVFPLTTPRRTRSADAASRGWGSIARHLARHDEHSLKLLGVYVLNALHARLGLTADGSNTTQLRSYQTLLRALEDMGAERPGDPLLAEACALMRRLAPLLKTLKLFGGSEDSLLDPALQSTLPPAFGPLSAAGCTPVQVAMQRLQGWPEPRRRLVVAHALAVMAFDVLLDPVRATVPTLETRLRTAYKYFLGVVRTRIRKQRLAAEHLPSIMPRSMLLRGLELLSTGVLQARLRDHMARNHPDFQVRHFAANAEAGVDARPGHG